MGFYKFTSATLYKYQLVNLRFPCKTLASNDTGQTSYDAIHC